MSELTLIIVVVSIIALGALWYTEHKKRKKAENEIALAKARRPLEELKRKIDKKHLSNYTPKPIPDDLLIYVTEPDEDSGGDGDDSEGIDN